jgi:hypothetical protein
MLTFTNATIGRIASNPSPIMIAKAATLAAAFRVFDFDTRTLPNGFENGSNCSVLLFACESK